MIVFRPVSFPLHAAGHGRWFHVPDPGSARAGVGNSSPHVPGVLQILAMTLGQHT